MMIHAALGLALSLWPEAVLAQDDSKFSELEREATQVPGADAQDFDQAREEMRRAYADGARRQSEEIAALSAQMQKDYARMLERLEAQRRELRGRVERQWTQFLESTTKVWVDYSPDAGTRSTVDFEKGEIEIEALVPVEEVRPGKTEAVPFDRLNKKEQAKVKSIAQDKLGEQVQRALAQKGESGAPVLEDQVKAPDGRPVTPDNARTYVKETLPSKIEVESKPVVAQDGKPRLKVTVKIPMVPEHLRIRAQRHKPRVEEVSRKYRLDPALVFAVIHTESQFNPQARSPAPAFGLMQLMPPHGAREAYKFLHREDKIVSPEYLYDPDNNILLGATYLHLLETRDFKKVKNSDSRRSLMIAAYNCGPGCVRKNVLSQGDPNAATPDEINSRIRRYAPKETREYLPQVQSRMELYREL